MTLEQIISEHEREIGRLNTLLICPTLSDGTRKETFQKLKRSELILSALCAQQVHDAEPKALTLAELRERDGKPVWLSDGIHAACGIINAKREILAGLNFEISFSRLQGTAYDRPPKEEK
jgi:hypothetical protein